MWLFGKNTLIFLILCFIMGCALERYESEIPLFDRFSILVHESLLEKLERLDAEHSFYYRPIDGWPINSSPEQHEFVGELNFTRPGWIEPLAPSDDRMIGDELLRSIRNVKVRDAVPFGAISNQMARTACVAWIGRKETFAGILIFTPTAVYFVNSGISYFESKGHRFDTLPSPPYYLWENPYFSQSLRNAPTELQSMRRYLRGLIRDRFPDFEPERSYFLENYVICFLLALPPDKFPLKGLRNNRN